VICLLEVDAQELIDKLGLKPLTIEGGYFFETYRSDEILAAGSLDPRYGGDRAVSTAIYYLLVPGNVSKLHRLRSDEIFHFYAGDAVEMLQLLPDGSHRMVLLGSDIARGQMPQVVVPRGVWQGARLVRGGKWALLGTTVAPGFDYEDFEAADRAELIRCYPECADTITELTDEPSR